MRLERATAAAAALALVAALAVAGDAGLPAPLEPFTADYRLTNGSVRVGGAEIALEPNSGGWRYRSRTEAEGIFKLFMSEAMTETTLLERDDGDLRPLRYRHDDPDDDDDVTVAFHWDRGEATVTAADGRRTLGIEAGTRDSFSAVLALMQALAKGHERITIPAIDDDGEAETLRFRVEATETIEVPLGTYQAIRVRREREDSSRQTLTWAAPALGYVPVRIEQHEDDELSARLELIGLNGKTAQAEPPAGR